MAQEKIYPPQSDCFAQAWKTCFTLWPLFFVQLAFLVLEYAVLWFLLILLVGPFLENNWDSIAEGIKDPQVFDWSSLLGAASAYFDVHWFLLALGAMFLYVFWWSFLSALASGGVYRAYWENLEKGEKFSFTVFFKNSARYLFPMLFYQAILVVLSIVLAIAFTAVFAVGAGLTALLFSHSALAGIVWVLALVPVCIAVVLLGFAFGAYVFLWKAEITREKNAEAGFPQALKTAWDSLWEAGRRFRENRWRIGIGLTVAFLVYMVVNFGLRFFLGILGSFPVIGLLFTFLDLLAATTLLVLFLSYLPALSVAYLLEKEM